MYTSGIESFISMMETSSLMGANVVALVAKSWEKGAAFSEKSGIGGSGCNRTLKDMSF